MLTRLRLAEYFFISPPLATLGFLLALVLLAHLLKQQRSPVSTMAWLLIIILVPFVGVPFYLMFGGRKMRKLASKKERVYPAPTSTPIGTLGGTAERILQSYGVPPATAGNRVALVPTGDEAYHKLLEIIDAAKRSIHITTYILGTDSVGRSIVDRLAARAAQGIEVRLLLDSYGSWRVRRKYLAKLYDAGARVAFFMPILHVPFRGRANLRNHRKIVVVDGAVGLVGGMNLAEPYMGPQPDPRRWRDLSLVVEGPAAYDLDELFCSDWKFTTGEDMKPAERPEPAPPPANDTPVQVVASGPDVDGDPLYDSLISMVFAAKERIWIVTPYFIPDEALARAIELASRRGVDVRLVVPQHSNHLMADLARVSYLRQVHDAGGNVLLFTPVMVHAKVLLIDNDLSVIGSANMDIRSLFLNYEVALFLYARHQVAASALWIEGLMSQCKPGLPPRGRFLELAEGVVRLLSPLL